MSTRLLVALVTAGIGVGHAVAGPVRLSVTGGSGVNTASTVAALEQLTPSMAPCFRKASGPIVLNVAVGADGEVASAQAETAGSAGQCAAGLLAVAALPTSKAAWQGRIEIDPVTLEQRIGRELGEQRGPLAACQEKDPARRGELSLQLSIAAHGAVSKVSIVNSSGSAAIDTCAVAAASKLSVRPIGNPVRYRLSLRYEGAAPPPPQPVANGASGATSGSVSGALDPQTVQRTWESGAQSKVAACAGGAKGSAVVTFKVRADGTVKNVTLKESSLKNPAFAPCVDTALRALKFPLASDETFVKIPIRFGTASKSR